jgi:hypothetical protein
VPINWVAHFYYAVGLIAIIGAVAHMRMVSATESYSTEPAVRSVGRSVVPTVAATLFLALLIPFANVVLPRLVQTRVEERARSALAAALPEINPGVQFSYGEALYPYYDAGAQSFSFDLVGNTGYQGNLVVARDDILPRGGLQTAALAVAGLFRDDEGLHVKFLYVADQK